MVLRNFVEQGLGQGLPHRAVGAQEGFLEAQSHQVLHDKQMGVVLEKRE